VKWLADEAACRKWNLSRASVLHEGPVVVCWEHARVVTSIAGIVSAFRTKRRGCGEFLGVRALEPSDPWHPTRVLYVYLDTLPSNVRKRRRGADQAAEHQSADHAADGTHRSRSCGRAPVLRGRNHLGEHDATGRALARHVASARVPGVAALKTAVEWALRHGESSLLVSG
jgi:hypothetical protein